MQRARSMFNRKPRVPSRRFRRGDLVEVHGANEILATLDARGRLDGLPFMPEMVPFCGRRFHIHRRVEKVYLDRQYLAVGMKDTVLLREVRCDGVAHGGCQMGCLLLWKTAWLKPVDNQLDVAVPDASPVPPTAIELPTTDGDRFRCQAAQLGEATFSLSKWDVRQYVADHVGHERSVGELGRMMLRAARNKGRWRLGLPPLGTLRGSLTRTPEAALNLQPGELVQVKSREEIRATLDREGRNRGLGFAPDMLRFCGNTYRVARRVERTVQEWSGQLREIRNTVALEGVTCSGIDQRCCPRECYHLWREIWLSRTPRNPEPQT